MTPTDLLAAHAAERLVDNLTAGLPQNARVDVDKADAAQGYVTVDISDYLGDIRDEALDGFTARYDRYVNQHNVPVKRLVLTGPEEVDGAALQDAA